MQREAAMNHQYGFAPVITFLSLALLLTVSPAQARTYDLQGDSKPILMPGRLEVQFEKNVNTKTMAKGFGTLSLGVPSLDQIFSRYQVREAVAMFPWRQGADALYGDDDMSKFFELFFDEAADINSIISELRQNPNIKTVSPVWAIPVRAVPNDQFYGMQWAPPKTMSPAGWDIQKSTDTAKIAIIDSGVLFTHPDLKDKIWVNPGEDLDDDMVVFDSEDVNGIDDDGNGVIDDLIGYDFFSGFSGITCWTGEDCGTPDNNPTDYNGHGTHCAGIAGATTNNSTGVAGLAGGWGGGLGTYAGARIMCLRVGGSGVNPNGGYETGYVNTANCATAIDYAARMGACVINASWGAADTPAMRTACNRANDSGVVITHAAGNDDNSQSDFLDYYSYNGYPVSLSVAATTSGDAKASFSNYGAWIDVSAPGVSIYNTYSDHGSAIYSYLSGTSMAAPHVAGLAALIKSHMPNLRKEQIDTIIMNHADDIDVYNPFYPGQLGSGRINVCSSLTSMPNMNFTAGPVLVGLAPLTVDFTDISPVTAPSWLWDFGDGGSSTDRNPSHTYTQWGLYNVSMTGTVPKGTHTRTYPRLVMVIQDTLKIDSIVARPGDTIEVPIRLTNFFQIKQMMLPIEFSDATYLDLWASNPFSVNGLRTSYFQEVTPLTYDPTNLRFRFRLTSNTTSGSNYLDPGTGAILNIYVIAASSVPGPQVITIDTTEISTSHVQLYSIVNSYTPAFKRGKIIIANYLRGDANTNGVINILDATFIISFLFKGGPAPDVYAGDANGSGNINILDATYLISYLFKNGPPPPL